MNAQPGTVSRRHARAERLERVLDVAARAFADRGFHDVSMDDVAAAAGVSKPVVYTHFESKEGLYEAALERAVDRLSERVRARVEPEVTAEGRMWAGICALLDAVEEHPDWWRLASRAASGVEPFADVGRRLHDTTARLVLDLFADTATLAGVGNPEASAEPFAQAFVGACGTVADWWIGRSDVPKGTVAITLMNMMWMGFGDLVEARVWLPPDARENG